MHKHSDRSRRRVFFRGKRLATVSTYLVVGRIRTLGLKVVFLKTEVLLFYKITAGSSMTYGGVSIFFQKIWDPLQSLVTPTWWPPIVGGTSSSCRQLQVLRESRSMALHGANMTILCEMPSALMCPSSAGNKKYWRSEGNGRWRLQLVP